MAEQNPSDGTLSHQHFTNEQSPTINAGPAEVLYRDGSQSNNGDGSGSGIESGEGRGHQNTLDPNEHSSSPEHAPSHSSYPEDSSRSSTPIQPTNHFHPPTDHHQHRQPSAPGHEGFVQPSSYLRRTRGYSRPMAPPKPPETAVDREQRHSLRAIRKFLKTRTSYDVSPVSFRLIVFDTSLLVKRSLSILTQNGIVSAPLWDSKSSSFAGLLTTSDYINVIQYYWQNPEALSRMDQFRLSSLPEIERAIGVIPLETVSIHPLKPLYEACRRMLDSRARRIPLIDIDDETKRPTIVNVITQYRILKFVAMNASETRLLRKPLRQLHLGTYENLQTARMETPVMEVIHQLVKYSISSVPILNSDGVVVNVFEAVDVISLIRNGAYDDLGLSVGEALQKRAPEFPGIYTCLLDDRLDSIFDIIRKSRVHRFVVIDEGNHLRGLLSLSDILSYILLEGEGEDE